MKKRLVAAFLFAISALGQAEEHLTIMSPHRKTIQDEFVPRFVEYYKKKYKETIKVDWIDQGGTENELRYVIAKYEKNNSTSGFDVFWGGGDMTFFELENRKLLETYNLPASLNFLPAKVVGIPLHSANKLWYGTALSSFGIFYNKPLLKMQKLAEPQTWADLGKPEYLDHISVADPRRSSTAMFMNLIMLESLGWEKGWQLLHALAGNARSFSQSSSDPIKAVVSGDVSIAPAIDFYAGAKISELGESNLGFALPVGQTILNSDPIGILKGPPHRLQAERFVEFVLSEEAQKILILRKGSKDGPRFSNLSRMAINPKAYENLEGQKLSALNPFQMGGEQMKISFDKLSNTRKLLADLMGALHIDTHSALRESWTNAVKTGTTADELQRNAAPPIAEKDVPELLKKWGDNSFRNRKINEWISFAQAKYKKKGASS